MQGDTQAQNSQGRDGESPKGQHAWGKRSEGGKQWSMEPEEAGK